MSLSVKYLDIPEGAQEEAVASATNGQPFSSAEQITQGAEDIPWATLEPFSWSLDGSRRLLPDNPQGVGWWSDEISGGTGAIDYPPVITVSFPQPYTATGITFWFWPSLGQWCDEIAVTWYNGDTVLAQVTAYPDDAKWVLAKTVESFDKIEITLLHTNIDGMFAKIQQIQIGHVIVFFQDELVRVSLLNEIDPSLCELSTDMMKVEIMEKKGMFLIPQKNQKMVLFRDDVQIASQYITDSSRKNQRFYTFQCQSSVGRLEDVFMGGVYFAEPAENLLTDILEGFQAEWTAFSDEWITGYIPVCTRREALQQIAFAIGAVVTTQGDGTIRLVPLTDFVDAEFSGDDIFSGAKITREAQIATVQVYAHRYVVGEEVETLLENEEINGSNVLYVFSEPHYNYTITGGNLDSQGDNWVRITASGPVTLTAQKFIHSTSVRRKDNPYATAAEKANIVSVENATLVHAGNVDDVLDRLYEIKTLNHVLSQDVIVDGQKAGQKARSITPWGTATVGYITSMESEFTNTGHTASITIRGKEEDL